MDENSAESGWIQGCGGKAGVGGWGGGGQVSEIIQE